ncbi:hypothetical protein DHEL01_v209862 [Diaporthe helianthi]|uniref:Zn(2)-C6 fungal-type domain-containing protein n=1 Tax=Diaporthe helianthi TaxID=158607 RepID=A0A2P5HNA8_DIAHE|nr:hypothetical protein DHEL01_v209862 [Diaporthe helianthi]
MAIIWCLPPPPPRPLSHPHQQQQHQSNKPATSVPPCLSPPNPAAVHAQHALAQDGQAQRPGSTHAASALGIVNIPPQPQHQQGHRSPQSQQGRPQTGQYSSPGNGNGNGNGNYASSASPQSQQAPTPAASTSSAPAKKNTRIPRACDLCSTRKVKCEGGTPPCAPCRDLGVPCTYDRVKKRRGPPNRAAEAARQAEKRQKLDTDAPSDSSPPHQNAAQALVSLGTSGTPTVMDAEQCIAPLGVLELFIDDFYTYIFPLVPFPHEPTFRAAFERREDRTNPDFLALLAGMVAALVASFPRSARLHLKASHSYEKFPRSVMLVDRCVKVALDMRNSETMLKDTATVNDAAVSYFVCLAMGYTMRYNQCRRFMGECLRFLREMGFHRRRPPPTSLSLNERSDEQPNDFITEEIGKRIYWTVFFGVRSMTQLGASSRDLIIPPATPNTTYPDWPREVDDAYILPDRILPQPEGTVSILTEFVRCIQNYQTMDDLVRIELAHGTSAYTWEQQKQYLHESLMKVKAVEAQLPPALKLDLRAHTPTKTHAKLVQKSSADASPYQYVPPAYPNTQPTNDVRHLFAADENKKRHLQYEIQKANLYASIVATRSYYVERYMSLREIYLVSRRAEQARLNGPGGSVIYRTAPDMSSSSLAAAAVQAVSGLVNDGIDDMFFAERDEVVHNFFTVLMSIDQHNMEPNGASLISKIRQVASTLLGDPDDRKRSYELQNEEYLRVFLEILTRLEKTGTGAAPSPGGPAGGTMTCEDEEQELRSWADLREQQERMARIVFV